MRFAYSSGLRVVGFGAGAMPSDAPTDTLGDVPFLGVEIKKSSFVGVKCIDRDQDADGVASGSISGSSIAAI